MQMIQELNHNIQIINFMFKYKGKIPNQIGGIKIQIGWIQVQMSYTPI